MILPDHEITVLCQQQALVSPFDPRLVNPASLDVRLGERLMIETADSDLLQIVSIAGYTKQNPFLLQPLEFCLAETLEVFRMPSDIAGQFVLKSSRAREGLSHALAGYLDPGWTGSKLTLELHNIRRLHPIKLWPGLKIGQVVFHLLTEHPTQSYLDTGHYNFQRRVMPSWEAS